MGPSPSPLALSTPHFGFGFGFPEKESLPPPPLRASREVTEVCVLNTEFSDESSHEIGSRSLGDRNL